MSTIGQKAARLREATFDHHDARTAEGNSHESRQDALGGRQEKRMKRFAQYVLVTVMVVLMFAIVEPYLYPRKSWTVEGCTVNRDAQLPNGMSVRLSLRGPTLIEAEEETGLTKCIIPMEPKSQSTTMVSFVLPVRGRSIYPGTIVLGSCLRENDNPSRSQKPMSLEFIVFIGFCFCAEELYRIRRFLERNIK
jgi:hypothetical protein